jgi:Transmembrane amino acid transporter protein
MRESGFFAGLGLLVALSFLTDWTIRLIVLNAKLSGRQTYIEIMEHCFGGNGKAAVSIFQFAFAFGGMCAFCVVIGDTLPHVIVSVFPSLENSFLSNRQFVISACTITISYPLSLYRNVESLSKASALALVSMVLIILTVAIRGPAMPAELRGDSSLMFTVIFPSKIVRSIAVISFAFVCHHNSLRGCAGRLLWQCMNADRTELHSDLRQLKGTIDGQVWQSHALLYSDCRCCSYCNLRVGILGIRREDIVECLEQLPWHRRHGQSRTLLLCAQHDHHIPLGGLCCPRSARGILLPRRIRPNATSHLHLGPGGNELDDQPDDLRPGHCPGVDWWTQRDCARLHLSSYLLSKAQ